MGEITRKRRRLWPCLVNFLSRKLDQVTETENVIMGKTKAGYLTAHIWGKIRKTEGGVIQKRKPK